MEKKERIISISEINWNTALGEECTKIYSKGKKNTREEKNSNNAEIETLNHPNKYKKNS